MAIFKGTIKKRTIPARWNLPPAQRHPPTKRERIDAFLKSLKEKK